MSAPGHETEIDDRAPFADRAAVALSIGGALLAVGAGLALWAGEGAGIFLEGAVNAILTCF